MPTDCPTREKHGWMGDALDGSEQALMNFEMGPVHEAFMQVIEDNQSPRSGDVPVVVPGYAKNCDDIAWTSAYPQITAMQHQYYSDTRTLERKYSSLVKYTGADSD
jgi:alpha-L-rhamnosidase